jgi:hypothetical protein
MRYISVSAPTRFPLRWRANRKKDDAGCIADRFHDGGRNHCRLVVQLDGVARGWMAHGHACRGAGHFLLAFSLARRYATDQRFAFGTWKIEVLGGFVSGILLGIVGVAMSFVSIERLCKPVTIHFNQAIFVAVIGLAVNVVSIFLSAIILTITLGIMIIRIRIET